MAKSGSAGDDRELEEEIGRLYDEVRRDLAFGRIGEARKAADELLRLGLDSTTANELNGDVLIAEGQRKPAMAAYKRAMELEEANVDAERKYAELTLSLGNQQRINEQLRETDLEHQRGAAHKDPSVAAIRSVIFPGLGQLYNGEYEKGIAFVIGAFALIVLAAPALLQILPGAANEGAGWTVWLAWPAFTFYVALYAYSIYDAWRVAKSQDEAGLR